MGLVPPHVDLELSPNSASSLIFLTLFAALPFPLDVTSAFLLLLLFLDRPAVGSTSFRISSFCCLFTMATVATFFGDFPLVPFLIFVEITACFGEDSLELRCLLV